MKNQLEILDEVVANFSEEEKQLMDSNRFAYIFSKAWLYLKIGPQKYRKNDAFQQPPLDYDEEDFQIFTQNQKNRDHGRYHITVINVMDCNRLSKEMGMVNFVKSVELAFEYPVEDLELLGLGTASKNDNTAYFIVCQSDSLDAVRTRFNLTKQDFHTTLGFNTKDVFGVPKNVLID
jgi:hypothetical protein